MEVGAFLFIILVVVFFILMINAYGCIPVDNISSSIFLDSLIFVFLLMINAYGCIPVDSGSIFVLKINAYVSYAQCQ